MIIFLFLFFGVPPGLRSSPARRFNCTLLISPNGVLACFLRGELCLVFFKPLRSLVRVVKSRAPPLEAFLALGVRVVAFSLTERSLKGLIRVIMRGCRYIWKDHVIHLEDHVIVSMKG